MLNWAALPLLPALPPPVLTEYLEAPSLTSPLFGSLSLSTYHSGHSSYGSVIQSFNQHTGSPSRASMVMGAEKPVHQGDRQTRAGSVIGVKVNAYTMRQGSWLPGSAGCEELGRLPGVGFVERGTGLHMARREAGLEHGHFLQREQSEQRHKDVNHRACSGNPIQWGLMGCDRGAGCCTGDKARVSEQARAWGAFGLCLCPRTNIGHASCCLPPVQAKPHIYQVTSSPDLLPSPWTLSLLGGNQISPWHFRECQLLVKPSAAPSGRGSGSPHVPWPGRVGTEDGQFSSCPGQVEGSGEGRLLRRRTEMVQA